MTEQPNDRNIPKNHRYDCAGLAQQQGFTSIAEHDPLSSHKAPALL